MLERATAWLRASGHDAVLKADADDGGPAVRHDAILVVRQAGDEHRFGVQRRERSPYPNEIPSLTEVASGTPDLPRPLLSAPYVSEGTADPLRTAGWSWADDVGNLELRSGGLHISRRVADRPPRKVRSRHLPLRGGGLAIARFLITQGGEDLTWGPSHLAGAAGVSQPRASQVLADLEADRLVERVGRGEWRADREALLDAFMAVYPGPGGTELPAYSLDAPLETAVRLSASVPSDVAVSADVGPDLRVPVRRPTMLIVYCPTPLDLDTIGLTTAPTRSEANVLVRTPADSSVFGVHKTVVDVDDQEVALADPTQLLWDLEQLGGRDRHEAAGELRSWLLSR
jgi:hypothetical protein